MSDIKVKVSSDTSQFQKGVSQMERSLNGLKNITAAIGAGMAFGAMTNMLGKAAGFAGDLVKSSAQAAINAETVGLQFEVLVGNAGRAKALLKDIEAFGQTTPLQKTDLQESAKMLLSFGISVDNVLPVLQKLGDISMGDAEKLSRLSRVFGQVASGGRLTLEDVNQLIDAGFNPLSVISEKTGRSVASMRDAISNGEMGIADLAQALDIATGEGGLFNNMLKRIGTETTGGALSNLEDTITKLKEAFGTGLMGGIKGFAEKETGFLTSLTTGVTELGVKAGGLLTALTKALPSSLKEMTDALNAEGGSILKYIGSLLKEMLHDVLTDTTIKSDIQAILSVVKDELKTAATDIIPTAVKAIPSNLALFTAGTVLKYLPTEKIAQFIPSIGKFKGPLTGITFAAAAAKTGYDMFTGEGAGTGSKLLGGGLMAGGAALGGKNIVDLGKWLMSLRGGAAAAEVAGGTGIASGARALAGRIGPPGAAIAIGATIGDIIGSFLARKSAEKGFERATLYGAKSDEELKRKYGSPSALVAGKTSAEKAAEAIKAAEDIFGGANGDTLQTAAKKTTEAIKESASALTNLFKPAVKDLTEEWLNAPYDPATTFAGTIIGNMTDIMDYAKGLDFEPIQPTNMTQAITRSLTRVGGGGDIFTGGPINLQREGNKILTRIERNTRNATIGLFA